MGNLVINSRKALKDVSIEPRKEGKRYLGITLVKNVAL